VVRGLAQGTAQLAIVAALLARTDPWLAFGVLAVFLGRLVVTRVLRDRVRRLVVDEFDLSAELASRVHETMLGIRIVKSFGAERFELARFIERARHLARVTLKGGVYRFVEMPLGDVADAIGLVVVLLMAFSALAAGRLSVAGMVLFMVLVRQALVPIALVTRSVLLMQTLVGAARPLLEILRETPAVADGTREAAPLRRAIELEDVEFRYEPGPAVLEGISLAIRRGEVVALVGPSGAGKSTLADLIVRLCDPTRGRVTWDGVDVRTLRQESYRRRVGVVSQEALLFNATVAENIAYGRPLDGDAVARAARVAHADGFIGALPRGLDTLVGERGVQLSGGQRQRIAIARAVYGAPDVLLLDEATSALDGESEAAVQSALDEVSRGVTVIVIAHRLSTVIHADRIVMLEAGRITATGTHGELLETSPLYRRLCAAQFLDLTPRASPSHARPAGSR
jgi:subfamily B ATP-binding cassette protein MsbA